jgi:hypothetical protein
MADLITPKGKDGGWLIVCHKPRQGVIDVQRLLRQHLPGSDGDRVDFLTWGRHAAVNDFADTQRIILAGTLFHPEVYYEALKRLCIDSGPSDLAIDDGELQETRIGEYAHVVLQALCRASVRKSEQGAAAPCTAYLIASTRSGIREKLPVWFPGCHVVSWRPAGPEQPTGQLKRVINYVAEWVAKGAPGGILGFSTIYTELNIREDRFRELRADERLKAALKAIGVEEVGRKKYKTGYGIAHGGPKFGGPT